MRILRASEVNSFLYCQRAWWYRLQGIPSETQGELERGQLVHRFHAHRVQRAVFALRIAYLLVLVAGLLLLWHLIG